MVGCGLSPIVQVLALNLALINISLHCFARSHPLVPASAHPAHTSSSDRSSNTPPSTHPDLDD